MKKGGKYMDQTILQSLTAAVQEINTEKGYADINRIPA